MCIRDRVKWWTSCVQRLSVLGPISWGRSRRERCVTLLRIAFCLPWSVTSELARAMPGRMGLSRLRGLTRLPPSSSSVWPIRRTSRPSTGGAADLRRHGGQPPVDRDCCELGGVARGGARHRDGAHAVPHRTGWRVPEGRRSVGGVGLPGQEQPAGYARVRAAGSLAGAWRDGSPAEDRGGCRLAFLRFVRRVSRAVPESVSSGSLRPELV